MLKYSTRFKGENKRLFITAQHRAVADLMIMGWTPNDAYIAVGLYNAAFSDEYNNTQIMQITEDKRFLEYMQKKEHAIARGYKKSVPASIGTDEEEKAKTSSFRSKDEVIDALVETVGDLRGKEKADVLMKIADLQQMKKEEVIEEDNTVHFYLPISCKICELYLKAKKRKPKQEEINDDSEVG